MSSERIRRDLNSYGQLVANRYSKSLMARRSSKFSPEDSPETVDATPEYDRQMNCETKRSPKGVDRKDLSRSQVVAEPLKLHEHQEEPKYLMTLAKANM